MRSAQKKTIIRPQSVLTDSSFSIIATGFVDQTTPYVNRNAQSKTTKSSMNVLRAISGQHMNYVKRSNMNVVDENAKIYDTFEDDEFDDIAEVFNPNVKVRDVSTKTLFNPNIVL